MTKIRFVEVTARVLGSELTKRVLFVKGIVTATFVMWLVHPELATPVALVGNLIWLWVAPENETEKVRKIVHEAIEIHLTRKDEPEVGE